MANGYVLASGADLAAAGEVGASFGLDVIDAAGIGDSEAAAAALANAANVGLIISHAAAADAQYMTLLRTLAPRLPRAQLIAVDADARTAFGFLPQGWAYMTLADARTRAAEIARRQQQDAAAAAPPPPAPEEPPPPVEEPPPAPTPAPEPEPEAPPASADDDSDDDEAPSAEDVREYVHAEMRGYYEHKQAWGPIAESVDANGLSGFVSDTMAAPEGEEVTPAATMLHRLMRLALGALHARGADIATASFETVADVAVRLAGAADIDALADLMRIASENDLDPTALIQDAVARLANEPAIVRQEEPEESFGAPAEQERGQDPAPSGGEALGGAPGSNEAWSEDFEAAPPPVAAPAPSMPPAPEPPTLQQPSPEADAPPPPQSAAPPPASRGNPPLSSMDKMMRDDDLAAPPEIARKRDESYSRSVDMHSSVGSRSPHASNASAPADASAFAPKKLRRGTPELVQVVIHQPQDLKSVIKAVRKADARTEPAPTGMRIGDIAIGESIGVALEVRGAICNGAVQRRTWDGEPLHFSFMAEADEGVKQAVFIARVFVGDAQIGVIGFTRAISGPKQKAAGVGDALRMKRHKRVFISYSSKDRETVAAIATAYQAAGVAHFFDRTSLKSGEQWSPRLRKEIDRSDLFHLCWSKSAAASEWVGKEAEHALTRQKRSNGKTPAITVQMLDGPPWAPHPPELDSINFDDFVRAAIVGYARGDGET